MAAKIGILGESTSLSVATHTVYTVPADKAARVRIQFFSEGDSGTHEYAVRVGTPANEAQIVRSMAANRDFWTGMVAHSGEGTTHVGHIGLCEGDAGGILVGVDVDRGIMLPLPIDFFLSTGDTVRFAISSNGTNDGIFQVIGVEDDA